LSDTSEATRSAPRSLRGILREIGPGLIISANIVGSGELIVTTKLGADVGFALLWFIVLGCIVKVFVQLELGRYAISRRRTTLQAMDALDQDQATESVVLISKPPHPEVAQKIASRIARSPKPYTVCFIGAGPCDLPDNARQAQSLREAAELALGGRKIGKGFDPVAECAGVADLAVPGGRIEGLFSGGTLCAEAQVVLKGAGRRIASNAPVPGASGLDVQASTGTDRMIDLGADEYTRGRPHPMIDPSVRDEMFLAALQDKAVAVVLIDLVIGFGAHADPAGHLARLLPSGRAGRPPVIASVTGTELDPQCRSAQVARLREAGIRVAPSNAQASEMALLLAEKT